MNISGNKKLMAYVTGLSTLLLNHYFSGQPNPQLDQLIVALTAVYQAIEGAKDAVIGFAQWWKATHPDAQRPAVAPQGDVQIPNVAGR